MESMVVYLFVFDGIGTTATETLLSSSLHLTGSLEWLQRYT